MGRHRNYGGGGTLPPPQETDEMLKTTFSMSAAEILAGDITTKTVVTAPGPGKTLFAVAIVVNFLTNTTPYSGAGNIRLYLGAPTNDHIALQALDTFALGHGQDWTQLGNTGAGPFLADPSTDFNNQPLVLGLDAPVTLGDGTLSGTLFYAIA